MQQHKIEFKGKKFQEGIPITEDGDNRMTGCLQVNVNRNGKMTEHGFDKRWCLRSQL
jgi:hypothetical protein